MRRSRSGKRSVPGTYSVGSSNFSIRKYVYDKQSIEIFDNVLPENMLHALSTDEKCLIVINDFFDESVLRHVREHFSAHSLVLEDIVNTDQRCKYEKYKDYELCIVREPFHDRQLSLLLFQNYVILFQEKEDEDSVFFVLDRLRNAEGRMRERDTGYLAYAIIDSVIDDYFAVGEELENDVEEMEKKIEEEGANFANISVLKRKIVEYRKNSMPLREMVIRMNTTREDSLFGRDSRNAPFLADLVDHATRIVENAERLRDICFSLVDLHTGITSAKMNEIMKVLTVITTIFVPITFLTSVYGMNFEGIEEIHWKHGYLAFWLLVIAISGSLFLYFKRKKWL